MGSYQCVVDLNWSVGGGSPGTNTWHVRTDGAGSPATDIDDLMEIVRAFYTSLQERFPADLTIQWLGEATGILGNHGDIVHTGTWGLAGSGGTPHLPNAIQGCVTWTADTGGRSGRGRTFLGPLEGGQATDGGQPTSAFLADLTAAAADLVESSDSFANGAIGIYSRTDGVIRDITGAKVSGKFAVLRSRRD
jgi:hypothetical protein